MTMILPSMICSKFAAAASRLGVPPLTVSFLS